MQSRWLDLPCESRLEGVMLVGLPVVQPETLRYSGSLVFSWFFWIGRLAVRTTRKAGFWRVQKGRIRGGSYGERKRDVVPRPPAEALSTMQLAPARKVHGVRKRDLVPNGGVPLPPTQASRGCQVRTAWLDPRDQCGRRLGSGRDTHHTLPSRRRSRSP